MGINTGLRDGGRTILGTYETAGETSFMFLSIVHLRRTSEEASFSALFVNLFPQELGVGGVSHTLISNSTEMCIGAGPKPADRALWAPEKEEGLQGRQRSRCRGQSGVLCAITYELGCRYGPPPITLRILGKTCCCC